MESFKWFCTALKKYFNFTGRARRKEFWYFILFSLGGVLVLRAIEVFYNIGDINLGFGLHTGLISSIYLLWILCPTLAVTTRRLHDTNRSGWWQLIQLIPFVGVLVILVFAAKDSQPGDNIYGKNPRGKCMVVFY